MSALKRDDPNLKVSGASAEKPVWRKFPGPRAPEVKLRVAIERSANAELAGHARESLDKEVGGVLVGRVCEDDEGVFVHVANLIRARKTNQSATHVTFTQATWDEIHKTLEEDFPNLKIVGWYHTHPGYGVEFSEMDVFIQKNFFSGPTQIALVTDPVNAAVAIAVTAPGGIEYLSKYFVDGREQPAVIPVNPKPAEAGQAEPAVSGGTDQLIRQLEHRVSQLVQANDDLRAMVYRWLMIVGALACCAILATAGYVVLRSNAAPMEPPQVRGFAPIGIKIGDKTVMLGVGILSWEIPPELQASIADFEKAQAKQGKDATPDAKDVPASVKQAPTEAKPVPQN